MNHAVICAKCTTSNFVFRMQCMQGFGFGGLFDAKEVAAAKEQVTKNLTAKWAASKEAAAAKRQAAKAKVAAAKAAREAASKGKAVADVASKAKAVAQPVASESPMQQHVMVRSL